MSSAVWRLAYIQRVTVGLPSVLTLRVTIAQQTVSCCKDLNLFAVIVYFVLRQAHG